MAMKIRNKYYFTDWNRNLTSTAWQWIPSFVSLRHSIFHAFKKSRHSYSVHPGPLCTVFMKAACNYEQKNEVMWNRAPTGKLRKMHCDSSTPGWEVWFSHRSDKNNLSDLPYFLDLSYFLEIKYKKIREVWPWIKSPNKGTLQLSWIWIKVSLIFTEL